ncbi:MAG: hypothetical protein PHD02_03455 [Bacilli bacterium]|nr:hypothetical protein [Bacilli bacterium]
MILKKPYGLLIKHFKLIHIIFAVFSILTFSKISLILSFLNEYIANDGFIVEAYKVAPLLNFSLIIGIIVFILLNIVIIILMQTKQKKILFYISNIIFYALVIIIFSYTLTLFGTMQTRIVDTRIVRAIKDFYTIFYAVNIISIFMYLMRGLGFDVKKFNFNKDLVDLEITEADEEEVEVSVNVDVQKIGRKKRKIIRHLKYFYYEHQFICNIISIALSLIAATLIVYFTFFNSKPTYNQYTSIGVGAYNFEIDKVYVTNTDMDGNVIEEGKTFAVVNIKIKKRSTNSVQLNLGRFGLVVNGITYYHNYNYGKYFIDIGNAYLDESLSSDYQNYILVYPINTSSINKLQFNYTDSTNDIIVKINSLDFNTQNSHTIALGEEINFDDTILDGYRFTINKYEVGKTIQINYKYSITEDNYVSAVEYVTPTIDSNYDKAVLRLDYSFTKVDNNSYAANINTFLTNFGYLKYTVDGKEYTSKFNLGTLKAVKVNQPNTTYLEVKEEVLNAETITLCLKLRNNVYEIILKGGAQ